MTSFESIDEDDICAVEKFVREELEDFIKKNADFPNADECSLQKQQLIEHFGEFYAQYPKKFRFLPGDRKFIHKIQKHIHDVVNKKGRKKGFQHFSNKNNQLTSQAVKHTNELNKSGQIADSTFTDDGLKTKLFNLISDKLVESGVPLSMREIFDETFISIANENNKLTGNVICVVCYVKSKNPESVKPKQVYCRGKSWVISNFIKHFTRAHSQRTPRKNNDISQPDNENEICEKTILSGGCVSTEYIVIEEVDPLTYEMNYSTESLENFIANETTEMEKKFNDQITSQLIKMWNTVLLNGESHNEQVRCMCENGVSVSFDVAEILKNGDCMYGSLAHQIYRYDLNSAEHKQATQKLRMDVVNYIEENYEEFKQQLCGHIVGLEENGFSESLGLHEIDDIDAKCKHLLNDCMIKSGFWASGESLKATACLHDVNIIVFYEEGPIYCVHKTGQLSEQTVVIAFRLLDSETGSRNHYDSVYYISAPEIYTTAKFISEVISQDSNVMIDLVTSP